MREHSKRWLLSMMKTSGSKRKNIQNGRFADGRHTKGTISIDELPCRESIKSTFHFYNGKINYGLLVRFLRGKVGKNWDEVYSEITNRIPTALLDYKEMIFWFVADKVIFEGGKLLNKKSQRYIWTGETFAYFKHCSEVHLNPEFVEFYVHPDTNKLERIPQMSFKKLLKINHI